MSKSADRLLADVLAGVQQVTGVSKSDGLAEILMPLCRAAAGDRHAKKLAYLGKAVKALQQDAGRQVRPKIIGKGLAPMNAGDYFTTLRRVTEMSNPGAGYQNGQA